MTLPPRHGWSTRTRLILLTVFVLLVALRLALPTFARNYANRQLNRDPLYRGEIQKVGIHLWRGAYSAHQLKLERVQGQKTFPLLAADRVDVGISWKDLLHAALRMKLEIHGLKINVVREHEEGEKKVPVGQESHEGKEKEAQTWQSVFKNLVPIDVERLIVRGDSIHFRDITSEPKVNVFIDQLSVDGKNLTNSERMSKSLYGDVEVRGRLMESGKLHVTLHADPLAEPIELKATTELESLELTQLNDFFSAYGDFDVKKGTLGITSEMAVADNRIKGYVKPIIKDLEVADLKKDVKKGGILHAAWQGIVGAIGGIFKNHKKDQQAARIPFEGRLDNPDTSLWETFRTVLENMLVKPITPNVEHSVDLNDVKKDKK